MVALKAEVAALPGQPSDVLKRRWTELYGVAPPSRLGRRIMVRAIAYRLQEQAHGGLSATSQRRLAEAATRAASGQAPAIPAIALKPGTRLLREWQGVTHEVIIGEDGITYRDRTWRSLSAVAREITGARWSGPRFFGLRSEKPSNG